MGLYHLLAVVLTGTSHVLLFIYLIDYVRFSWRSIITVGLLLTAVLYGSITLVGHPIVNVIALLIFLPLLGLLKKGLRPTHNLYYALFSLFLVTVARLLITEIIFNIVMLPSFSLYTSTFGLIDLIASSMITLAVILLRRRIGKLGAYLVKSRLYYPSYALLIAGMAATIYFSTPYKGAMPRAYADVSLQAAVLLFFILMIISAIGAHLSKEQLLEEEKRQADDELLSYMTKLEVMHDELASFRHDYTNLLLSLDIGIRNGNLEQIEHIYRETIEPSLQIVNNEDLDLAKLSRISIPAVKSVLSVKTITARQRGISVMIDIPFMIDAIPLPLPDFIRIVSIIIDNAIEAAEQSYAHHIEISFFEVDEVQQFIVRNSCNEDEIDLVAIFDKNQSDKGSGGRRGVGLFSLKRMIESVPHTTLETTFERPWFTQHLTIKKSSDRI